MNIEKLKNEIEKIWENRNNLEVNITISNYITETLDLLDKGKIRIAQKQENDWQVNDWIKKAILLSFKFSENKTITTSIINSEMKKNYSWYDKVNMKFYGWQGSDFKEAAIRAVPGSFIRYSSFIGKNVVLMPCFVNVGAYIDEGTMVDTWATIGSCAQIGKNCHISGGVGIGGVLEPLQANPVIIEDNCFIGARSEIAEGVIVEEGSVISMGVFIGASTKIIDRETGEIFYGRVPKYSVVVPGSIPSKPSANGLQTSLAAAIIVKKVDAVTRSKTSINELLRT